MGQESIAGLKALRHDSSQKRKTAMQGVTNSNVESSRSARKRELFRIYQELVVRLYRAEELRQMFLEDFDRIYFYYSVIISSLSNTQSQRILDLGAGLSSFAPFMAALGFKVTVADDFGGGGGVRKENIEGDREVINLLHRELAIEVLEGDFLFNKLPIQDQSVDVVTCFHSLEHWHHSPKNLLNEVVRVLKPDGLFFLATPNAVNLRKRFYVLFGRTNYPSLEEWYHDEPFFRGHVREPVLNDLQKLMHWNGFRIMAKYGRNFIGRKSSALGFLSPKVLKAFVKFIDIPLRAFPALCSDIHVVGKKPPLCNGQGERTH